MQEKRIKDIASLSDAEILAWDPDYTRLTDDGRRELEEARAGEYISGEELMKQLELDDEADGR